MKAEIKESFKYAVDDPKGYSLEVILKSESTTEAMRLGVLAEKLRSMGVWRSVDLDCGEVGLIAGRIEDV